MQKIIVFHGGALGDLVNTLPAFHALRERYPEASFTAVGNLAFLALFRAAGVFEEAISLERPGMHALWSDAELSPELSELLASHKLAVTWMRSLRLRESLFSAGLSVLAFTGPFPPPPGSGHVSDYMNRPLREIGINNFAPSPRLCLPQQIKDSTPSFPGILVHPGSGSPLKNLPPERFCRTAREIGRQRGIGMVCGPADEGPCSALAQLLGDDLKADFKGLSTIELAGLLESASLVIGNDSGVLHLAGALGTPALAVFGPTDPAIWGIKQKNAANLRPDCDCAPCTHEVMKKCQNRQCLHSVYPEEIISRGLELTR